MIAALGVRRHALCTVPLYDTLGNEAVAHILEGDVKVVFASADKVGALLAIPSSVRVVATWTTTARRRARHAVGVALTGPRAAAARRDARGHRGDLLHERHDGQAEGRDAEPRQHDGDGEPDRQARDRDQRVRRAHLVPAAAHVFERGMQTGPCSTARAGASSAATRSGCSTTSASCGRRSSTRSAHPQPAVTERVANLKGWSAARAATASRRPR